MRWSISVRISTSIFGVLVFACGLGRSLESERCRWFGFFRGMGIDWANWRTMTGLDSQVEVINCTGYSFQFDLGYFSGWIDELRLIKSGLICIDELSNEQRRDDI